MTGERQVDVRFNRRQPYVVYRKVMQNNKQHRNYTQHVKKRVALSFLRANQQLVDCNLRRRTVSRRFGCSAITLCALGRAYHIARRAFITRQLVFC